MSHRSAAAVARRVGHDGLHYFFGYYNKSNWDRGGRRLLAHQVPWADRVLTADLSANVGYFDQRNADRFVVIGSTTAWNWQMGAQLQWLGGAGLRVTYNVRTDSREGICPGFGAALVDLQSGERRLVPQPIYVAAPDGRWALGVNYHRLWITHRTIGYCDDRAAWSGALYPRDDGIYRINLDSMEYELIVSLRRLREFEPRASMERALHWVSHIEINPSATRVLFLHRWTERVADETCFLHRLITMNPDGSDLRLLECSDHPLPQLGASFDPHAVGMFDYEKSEYQISHPMWRDDRQIIVWGPHAGQIHYHLYTDEPAPRVEVVGRGILDENGHMSFSPVDRRRLLSDTYPDPVTHERALFLYDMHTQSRVDIGWFKTDPALSKENRCDLHPRWSPDGARVCFDSIHEGARRIYVADVASLVSAQAPAT